MAKISPVSIKYMIHANFVAEGALEKPDVIGAIFGQTEGLLGNDLEMRELQKEGKIGRIEVDLERSDKRTTGRIKIPTALDQSETTLIAAAVETIERIGPSDSQIEVERIEDVRGNKRDYIVERAKKLMKQIEGTTDSREISNQIKDSSKMADVQEYGEDKLPCGDISGKELIVVEGRADVLNLLRNGVKNVIAMNGTKLPNDIRHLSKEKDIILFVDGDRGGKLIVQNVSDNATIQSIVVAPDGKEVEELQGKEILMALRKKIPVEEFLSNKGRNSRRAFDSEGSSDAGSSKEDSKSEKISLQNDVDDKSKEKLKKLFYDIKDTEKAVFLDDYLKPIQSISISSFSNAIRRISRRPYAIIIDGTVTVPMMRMAEDSQTEIIVAKNFSTIDTKIKLLSL